MYKKIFDIYKIPVLLGITLAIVLIGVRIEENILNIIWIILGSLIGVFVLDLDIPLHIMFADPDSRFTKNVSGYMKNKDMRGAIIYALYHPEEVEDKTLHSVLFQLGLFILVFIVSYAQINILANAIILSTAVNSIYKMIESYFGHNSTDWFWSMKTPPSRNSVMIYAGVLTALAIFAISMF